MNRKLTNTIRYFMDEWLPPVIRDSKWFMYPFFYIAYGGKSIEEAMHFKSLVYSMTDEQYARFYNNLDTISRRRETDLSSGCIDEILHQTAKGVSSVADIGCGHGYLLNQLRKTNPKLELTGVDLLENYKSETFKYVKAEISKLPFSNDSFDVVTCCHVIEHIVHPDAAVHELERITKDKLIVVVPRQRYYYYTLDEHVNFFLYKEKLTSLFSFKRTECKLIDGDWFFIGYKA